MSGRPGGPRAPDSAYTGDPRIAPQIPPPNPFIHHDGQGFYESESDVGDYPSRRNTYMSDMDAQNPYYDHDYRELPHSFSFCADSLVGVGRCSLPVISRQAAIFTSRCGRSQHAVLCFRLLFSLALALDSSIFSP